MNDQVLSFFAQSAPPQNVVSHLVPYAILLVNCILFRLLRSFASRFTSSSSASITNATTTTTTTTEKPLAPSSGRTNHLQLFKLFLDELISTSELCADCAELNVVYDLHGPLAYGATLFILTYIWLKTFGSAHTTPGYLAEDYFFGEGNQLLTNGDSYARFIGQSLAMPLAWRLASLYWKYQLIQQHGNYLSVENCKSSLATSTMNGFAIEFICCLLCRLIELIGQNLLERDALSQRMVNLLCSFVGSILVVLALESSGGYFNPILAASLEYGCKGIQFYQHALVFWVGPLAGHIAARALFSYYSHQEERPQLASKQQVTSSQDQAVRTKQQPTGNRRSQRRKRADKLD